MQRAVPHHSSIPSESVHFTDLSQGTGNLLAQHWCPMITLPWAWHVLVISVPSTLPDLPPLLDLSALLPLYIPHKKIGQ